MGHMSELTVATLTHFTRPVTVAPLTKPNYLGEGLNMLYCVYCMEQGKTPHLYVYNICRISSTGYRTQACRAVHPLLITIAV